MTQEHSPGDVIRFVLIISALIGVALAPTMVRALPPRPTPEVTVTPTPEPVLTPTPAPATAAPQPAGATIALEVLFPSDWPWETTGWHDLWTAIQWQDPEGSWHDVQGWQGRLDQVTVTTGTNDQDGAVVGRKAWWVGRADLGDGPFRWVIAGEPGGAPLGISDAFSLPAAPRQTTTVEVVPEP